MSRWAAALAVVALLLAGCQVPAHMKPAPEPSSSRPAAGIVEVQALASHIAFFESQGDSGLAVAAALHFESKYDCRTGYKLAYWQEDQRTEEVLARVAATKELSLTYQYVAAATADALLPLPYQSVSGEQLEADFVGVLVGVTC